MQSDLERGHAHISSIAYFKLTSPLLSIAMVDAKQCKFKNQSSKESTEVDEINLECESEGESHEKGFFAATLCIFLLRAFKQNTLTVTSRF